MRQIPFSPPTISEDDIQAVVNVLRSGWITTGSVCEEFSKTLSHYVNAYHTSLVNSATSAMFIALKAMGIGEGDEVITTPYTFAATANIITHTGAKVVFVDVKKDSFYMDLDEMYQNLSPRTKAIIPVDFGTAYPWSLDHHILSQNFVPSNKFQERLGRPLIMVDSAHSLGSRFLDSSIDMAAFSFHAVKNLTTSEGGALAMNLFLGEDTEEFISMYKHLSLHGQNKNAKEKFASGSWEYDIKCAGYKCNMTDIAAAIGLSQLKRYESEILPKRRQLTERYIHGLRNNPRIILDEPVLFSDIQRSSCHLFPMRVQGFSEEQRNQFIQTLCENGISANVHFKPLHLMEVSSLYGVTKGFDNAVCQYQNEISLPLHLQMDEEDVDYIVSVINKELN